MVHAEGVARASRVAAWWAAIAVAAPVVVVAGAPTARAADVGTLTLSVPASANLGTASPVFGGPAQVDGSLGSFVVNDTRTLSTGWTVIVTGADFGDGAGHTISKSQATVVGPAAPTSSSGLAATGGYTPSSASLGTGGPIVVAVATGANTATFVPRMTVLVPPDTTPATYSGTLTITIL